MITLRLWDCIVILLIASETPANDDSVTRKKSKNQNDRNATFKLDLYKLYDRKSKEFSFVLLDIHLQVLDTILFKARK